MNKQCKKCNQTLPIESFYAHQAMKDGRLNYCIACVKARIAEHRQKNLDKVRAYDRKRGRTEERKLKNKEYQQSKKELAKKWRQAWIEKNTHKRKAHLAVQCAKARGLIKQKPCEICGIQKSEAHHPDYNKPLEVIWLCSKHHGELHRRYKE
jgi:hypothetical protein